MSLGFHLIQLLEELHLLVHFVDDGLHHLGNVLLGEEMVFKTGERLLLFLVSDFEFV